MQGLDRWITNYPDPVEYTPKPCLICTEPSETADAWLCYDCNIFLTAANEMLVYENKHGNSGVSGYWIDGDHLFIEFNEKVIYRYDQNVIGNQLWQNLVEKAESGIELSRLVFKTQPKYSCKITQNELDDLNRDVSRSRPI